VPYKAQDELKLPNLVAAIDQTNVACVVHTGDLKRLISHTGNFNVQVLTNG
jgi:hypothetical protein